jgi:glycosyltransferase involved in cell wall biosynthesis
VASTKIAEGFNAVDVKAFQDKTLALDRKELPGHAFLYVGQLIPRKRVQSIIEAFSGMAGPHDTLTILGSGEQEEDLRRRAENHEKIRFLPYIDNSEMPRVMATHNTLVLASSEEVWGLVVNEALASGLHTVVARNCGVVPSVEHMAGVFVAESDLADLTVRMAESRASWTGPILEPEILRFTPEKFASVFMRAIEGPSR